MRRLVRVNCSADGCGRRIGDVCRQDDGGLVFISIDGSARLTSRIGGRVLEARKRAAKARGEEGRPVWSGEMGRERREFVYEEGNLGALTPVSGCELHGKHYAFWPDTLAAIRAGRTKIAGRVR